MDTEQIEQTLSELWKHHEPHPRFAVIGPQGRDYLMSHKGFRVEDFTEDEDGGFYIIGDIKEYHSQCA